MFERFTEPARRVVVFAHDEANGLKHTYIGAEHILLGLLREEDGIAAQVLDSIDMTAEEVRAQLARIIGVGNQVAVGQIPFTARAKRVLERALQEALSLGHRVGTEHLLLGLLRENGGVSARVLADFDASPREIADRVARMAGWNNRGIDYLASYAASFDEIFSGRWPDEPSGDLIDAVSAVEAMVGKDVEVTVLGVRADRAPVIFMSGRLERVVTHPDAELDELAREIAEEEAVLFRLGDGREIALWPSAFVAVEPAEGNEPGVRVLTKDALIVIRLRSRPWID